jgi:hypothetical protein
MSVVHMLRNEEGARTEGCSLWQQICRSLQQDWEVLVCHTYDERNICADTLTHIGFCLNYNVIFHESCSIQILHVFLANKAGTKYSQTKGPFDLAYF